MKERLAKAHPHDGAAYVDGKDAFVKEHERRALAWAMTRRAQSPKGTSFGA